MAREISLFSGYEQRENRTTNYCLLVLRMLYDENPKLLAEAIAGIAGEPVADSIGVHFLQQQHVRRAVPDGLIVQKPFTVYIETKRFDWFYDDELERELEALHDSGPGPKVLLALSNFEVNEIDRFQLVRDLCETKYAGDIVFAALTFEDFYAALPRARVSRNLADLLVDFRSYLDDAGLFPRWRHRLDVINCAGSSHVVLNGHAYICPAAGGAYAHLRSRYFGMYKDKRVSHVAVVAGVVDLDESGSATVKWENGDTSAGDLTARARGAHATFEPTLVPARVFVLDELTETNFRKGTKGGLFGSKRYFDVEHLRVNDAVELAAKLNGLSWEDIGGGADELG